MLRLPTFNPELTDLAQRECQPATSSNESGTPYVSNHDMTLQSLELAAPWSFFMTLSHPNPKGRSELLVVESLKFQFPEQYAQVKLVPQISPKFRDENKKYLKPPPRCFVWLNHRFLSAFFLLICFFQKHPVNFSGFKRVKLYSQEPVFWTPGPWIYSFADSVCNWQHTSSNPVFKRATKKKLVQQQSGGVFGFQFSMWQTPSQSRYLLNLLAVIHSIFLQSTGPQLSLVYILICTSNIKYQKSSKNQISRYKCMYMLIYTNKSIYLSTVLYLIYHGTFQASLPRKEKLQVPQQKKLKIISPLKRRVKNVRNIFPSWGWGGSDINISKTSTTTTKNEHLIPWR